MAKSKPLDNLMALIRGQRGGRGGKGAATQTFGAPGTAIYSGFIQDNENNPDISSREERYKTYSDIMANTSIVSAGMRYFLNLVAKAEWNFVPSEADVDGRFAEMTEQALTEDPQTSWHRIVRRAAMYRFYGFSVQEWTAMRNDEGWLTYSDVAPRAQLTIERWDTLEDGTVIGIIQRSPQTSKELYIPRNKTMYVVDDTLNDSPEGLGLFRHLVAPARRLDRYEQLEGYGFETDLRGIPQGRGPFTELAKQVQNGEISQAQREQIEAPLRDFVQNHIKSAQLGILLDSMTYESKDEAGRASSARQWDVELLKGSGTAFADNAKAIERLNREMARILGVEQLMLGSGDSSGSFALSRDKTSQFFLLVDSTLGEVETSVEDDLIDRLFQLNGWPKEMRPTVETEAVRFTEVEQVAATLRDMATAGAPIMPGDPVVGEVRDLMGLSRPEDEDGNPLVDDAEDSAITVDENVAVPERPDSDGTADMPEQRGSE